MEESKITHWAIGLQTEEHLFYLKNKEGFKKISDTSPVQKKFYPSLMVKNQAGTIPVKELLITDSRLDKTFVIPNAAIEFLEMRTYSVCQNASATELKVNNH